MGLCTLVSAGFCCCYVWTFVISGCNRPVQHHLFVYPSSCFFCRHHCGVYVAHHQCYQTSMDTDQLRSCQSAGTEAGIHISTTANSIRLKPPQANVHKNTYNWSFLCSFGFAGGTLKISEENDAKLTAAKHQIITNIISFNQGCLSVTLPKLHDLSRIFSS